MAMIPPRGPFSSAFRRALHAPEAEGSGRDVADLILRRLDRGAVPLTKRRLAEAGPHLRPSGSHIVPAPMGDAALCKAASDAMLPAEGDAAGHRFRLDHGGARTSPDVSPQK
jgi:hypothetical protein